MVTSYYIMKLTEKNRETDLDKYYSVAGKSYRKTKYCLNRNKCRVCLKEGSVSIYGPNDSLDISEALRTFGDIEITENDHYPKRLCDVCYNFIRGAILFRRTAKETDESLKQSLKNETNYQPESPHSYSDINIESKDWSNSPSFKIMKAEKTIKKVPKVVCHICKRIVSKNYYKDHVTMHDPNHQNYVCDICGKSFRLRCSYYNHRLRHREDFPFKCQFCPYRGKYKELLKTHMRTHTGNYNYMCTECPARFLFKSNLNSHILKHKEPQFKCDSCNRAFHTKLTLQRHHEADHLGIRNHVCSTCGKAFGYRNAMMKHQRHVHKREKFLFGRVPSYLVAEQQSQNENG